MAVNKIQYAGRTLIDLTQDTVRSDALLEGTTAHDASGNLITGTISATIPNAPITSTGSYKITNLSITDDEIVLTIEGV